MRISSRSKHNLGTYLWKQTNNRLELNRSWRWCSESKTQSCDQIFAAVRVVCSNEQTCMQRLHDVYVAICRYASLLCCALPTSTLEQLPTSRCCLEWNAEAPDESISQASNDRNLFEGSETVLFSHANGWKFVQNWRLEWKHLLRRCAWVD